MNSILIFCNLIDLCLNFSASGRSYTVGSVTFTLFTFPEFPFPLSVPSPPHATSESPIVAAPPKAIHRFILFLIAKSSVPVSCLFRSVFDAFIIRKRWNFNYNYSDFLCSFRDVSSVVFLRFSRNYRFRDFLCFFYDLPKLLPLLFLPILLWCLICHFLKHLGKM